MDDATLDRELRERAAFVAEAKLIEQRHASWSIIQRRQAAWWRRWNTLTTVSAAVLAGAAGAAGLASEGLGTAAALAALVSAGLASIASSSGAAHRGEEAFVSAAANQALADQARIFRTTCAPHQQLTDVRTRFTELSHQRDQAVASAFPKLGRRALSRHFRNVPEHKLEDV